MPDVPLTTALNPVQGGAVDRTAMAVPPVDLVDFSLNLLLAAALSWLLGRLYVRYGTSLSNRRMFAANFVLLATTTMLIITVVKSSLALSLGLVGALSIVRFRAAIKEPEELAYLFLTIAIGLGCGAHQRGPTLVALGLIAIGIYLRSRRQEVRDERDYCLTITSSGGKTTLSAIVEVLRRHGQGLDLRRYDDTADTLEASFAVEFADLEALENARHGLRELDGGVQISFLDSRGVL